MKKLPVKPFRVLFFDVTAAVTASGQLSYRDIKDSAGKLLNAHHNDVEGRIISEAADMLSSSIRELHDTTTILQSIRNHLPAKYLSLKFRIIIEDAKLVNATKQKT